MGTHRLVILAVGVAVSAGLLSSCSVGTDNCGPKQHRSAMAVVDFHSGRELSRVDLGVTYPTKIVVLGARAATVGWDGEAVAFDIDPLRRAWRVDIRTRSAPATFAAGGLFVSGGRLVVDGRDREGPVKTVIDIADGRVIQRDRDPTPVTAIDRNPSVVHGGIEFTISNPSGGIGLPHSYVNGRRSGKVLWRRDLRFVVDRFVLAGDDSVLAASDSGSVALVKTDGTVVWSRRTPYNDGPAFLDAMVVGDRAVALLADRALLCG